MGSGEVCCTGSTTLRANRRRYHAQVAEELQRDYPRIGEEAPETTALHPYICQVLFSLSKIKAASCYTKTLVRNFGLLAHVMGDLYILCCLDLRASGLPLSTGAVTNLQWRYKGGALTVEVCARPRRSTVRCCRGNESFRAGSRGAIRA